MDSNRSCPTMKRNNSSAEALATAVDQEEDIELNDMSVTALTKAAIAATKDPTIAIIQPSSTLVISAQPSPLHHQLHNRHQHPHHHQHVHASPLMVHRQNGSIAIELMQPPSGDMTEADDFDADVNFKFLTSPDVKPTKSEVLHYFVQADTFFINRINHDMQITDEDGYPLFDAYVDVDFCNRIWRLEVYGRLVLSMYEPLSLCSELTRMRIPMTDWNGDFFGAIVPGDPFLILSSERQVVAKLILHRTPIIDAEESPPTLATSPPPSAGIPTKPCWLCVLEGSGRHVARLEDYQFIQFHKDVGFQLKLLTLAALVRLVGQLNPVNNFASVVKYVINCCANNY